RVKDDAPIGMDIWSVAHRYSPSGWNGHEDSVVRTLTPGARYPHTHTYRDILRVIDVEPAVEKTVYRNSVAPGVPVNFTVTYSADGAGVVPETVDGYEIVDTLPAGMTYVDGSATPEPTVTTNGQGQQVLSWT